MSSFKKNINNGGNGGNGNSIYTCSYCKYKYNLVGIKSGKCPKCFLWQPFTKNIKLSNTININRIFVINLEEDKQRWANFLHHVNTTCKLENKKIHRFLAVKGTDKNIMENMINKTVEKEDIDKVKKYGKELAGSTGCYLSHLLLWQTLLEKYENKEEYILIMEDDAYFLPHGIQNMEIVIEHAKIYPWDIMYIGHNNLKGSVIHPLFLYPRELQLHEPKRGINTGFFGYIVKISSLPKMIDIIKRFETPYIDLSVRENFKNIFALFLTSPLIKHKNANASRREYYDKLKL